MNEPSLVPQPKIIAVGVAGAALTIVLYVAGAFGLAGSEGAGELELGTALATVIAFAAGYMKSNK